ncbi:hypothetical protein [Embleya hyalina]|uniref:Uncharacterized protein n=1 Tax=Embleya hyalina TaxID=516124 RepID=A0A401Z5X2_9ACTN|nr:hypothetical protein [Embleya hyalina]GCE02243.1 hypothetical protein EHYA_10020 [Embleya hyalina]
MSADTTLVVPVEVAALAVNRQTRDTGDDHVIQRWNTNFRGVAQGNPPEPAPFMGLEQWRGDEDRLGVYLQWELPAALTRGRHDEDEGVGDFPLVPNRWLVVRHEDGTSNVRAWIVESDYLDPTNGTVSFQTPDTEHPEATKIGKCHDLTEAWREPDDRHTPFLTAIGPGLPTFSVFQPYNTNVFSMHDTLTGVEPVERLGYFVAGWYAQPDSDILAGTEDLSKLLDDLGWTAPPGSGSGIRRSVYSGTVLGLDWQIDGGVPRSKCPHRRDVTATVANSVMEAVGEAGTSAEGVLSVEEAELFRAFLLGGTEALAERDLPEADILTDRRAHDIGFGPVPGGYHWFIGARDAIEPDAPSAPAGRTFLVRDEEENTLLRQLNELQARADGRERELRAARERLYQLWWLTQREDQPDIFHEGIEDALAQAKAEVDRLSADTARDSRLPTGRTADQLAADIERKYPQYKARSARTLIRAPRQDFEYSADPVLALEGANLHAPLVRKESLPCRTPDRLVTAASGVTGSQVAPLVAKVTFTNLPPCFPALATEFFILDKALKTGNYTNVIGTMPTFGTSEWEMPWQPLFLMWKAEYFPLPFHDEGGDHWEFIERSRYRWKGWPEEGPPQEITTITASGRQMLAPTAGHVLEGEIAIHARRRDGLIPAETLRRLRSDAKETNVLSQVLDGFGAAIAQRQPAGAIQPPPDVAALLGDGDFAPPDPGGAPADDWDPWPPSRFQELRAGQMAFLDLSVVDRFGRAVDLIGDALHFRPEIVRTMEPEYFAQEQDADRLIELGPRLLQPARLRFDFLSADGDEDVELAPGNNPVCAWLVHNRLDKSLVVYEPTGLVLGELRVTLDSRSTREVSWSVLPGSNITDFEQLRTVSAHAYDLLEPVKTRGPEAFDAFRATVDKALHTIDPEGPADPGLGFLLGRPLALVRTRLEMEAHGPPASDVSWRMLFEETVRELPSYPWVVRMGEADQTDDGVVGYVTDGDYEHFDTVVDPVAGAGDYLRPIGDVPALWLNFGDRNTTVLTLLVDPRAAAHATTDILATKKVLVPQEFTDAALARMSVNFRTGDLLAASVNLYGPSREPQETVLMPVPATVLGEWSWTENRRGVWEKLAIQPQDATDLPLADPEIRSGFLTLDNAAAHTRSNEGS